jgi:signal recognition particle subunit SRP54
MFTALSEKLESTFKRLKSRGTLSPEEITGTLEEIRTALLEADVNVGVVTTFCEAVKIKLSSEAFARTLDPASVILRAVYEELVEVLGKAEPLNLRFTPPVIVLLVGLQGAGKTTTAGKLARYLKETQKRKPLLVSVDVYRPAAIEQLRILGEQLGIAVFTSSPGQTPTEIATLADAFARKGGFDTLIIDSAGRLQIDRDMMQDLASIVDAMTGQEAVNVAKGFNDRLDIDGLILTKLDGDARGGAALSMRSVTQKPIKFIGLGEKLDALDVFYPDRMASRILGMGDLSSFFEKMQRQISAEEAEKMTKKMKKADFTFEDFHSQLKMLRGMGSMSSLLQMVPGMGKVSQSVDDNQAERGLKRVEAIILSMTKKERQDPDLLNGSRRKRIALGSGTSVEEINLLVKQFDQMRTLMKKMKKGGGGLNLGSLMSGLRR